MKDTHCLNKALNVLWQLIQLPDMCAEQLSISFGRITPGWRTECTQKLIYWLGNMVYVEFVLEEKKETQTYSFVSIGESFSHIVYFVPEDGEKGRRRRRKKQGVKRLYLMSSRRERLKPECILWTVCGAVLSASRKAHTHIRKPVYAQLNVSCSKTRHLNLHRAVSPVTISADEQQEQQYDYKYHPYYNSMPFKRVPCCFMLHLPCLIGGRVRTSRQRQCFLLDILWPGWGTRAEH